jgi:SAM-dependent methyltransferase
MIVLDVGCGDNKVKGSLGVDCRALPGVDVVCDFEKDRLPFEDSSVDVIYTQHTLEHIRNLEHLLREFQRVLKPSGRLCVTVPHFSCSLGYSDPTHVRFFGYYTFDYFSKTPNKRWRVHNYTQDIWFKIVRKRLNFRNWSILAPLFNFVFNRGTLLPHIYDGKLTWLFPCFEITYELEADKG